MRSLWNGKREDKGMLYSWNFKEMAGIMIFENCHFAVIRFDFVKKRKKAATAPKKGDTTHEPSVVILAICEWSWYRLNMCTNFPNFIISKNYTGTLDTLACFPNFKWLSQEIATNSDSVTMMWSCQQQLCALYFKTIWLQKTCFSVKITRIIFSQFVLVLPLHAKF